MKKIDFLYIGPPKTGSSWLYQQLRRSADVDIPSAKDIYFFDRYFSKGYDWYLRFFNWESNTIKGELSHDYLYSKDALERIFCHNKATKIITIVRDPVARSLSHYRFSRKHGNVRGNVYQACAENKNILECSRYDKYLPRWISRFGVYQVLVIDFEDIARRPDEVLNRLEQFLCVTIPRSQDLSRKINASAVSRNAILAKLAKNSALTLRRLGLANLVGFLKSNRVVNTLLYTAGNYPVSEGEVSWLGQQLAASVGYHNQLVGRNAVGEECAHRDKLVG